MPEGNSLSTTAEHIHEFLPVRVESERKFFFLVIYQKAEYKAEGFKCACGKEILAEVRFKD